MPGRCTKIDEVEFAPVTDGDLRFTLISGDERFTYCMSRSVARRVAAKSVRLLDAADREDAMVVPIRRAAEYAATA